MKVGRSPEWVAYGLIAPSVVFLALLFLWPLTETALMAFREPGRGWTAVHLRKMIGDLNFTVSLKNTLLLVAAVVPVQLALALGMASLLDRIPRGRSVFLYIWTVSLGISDLAAGLAWLSILGDRGYFNTILHMAGIVDQPVNWLSYRHPLALFLCIFIAEVWRATAIVLVIVVAGWQLIPREYGEAAEVLGASPWQKFRRVTLPLLKPTVQSALILRTVLAFEVFAVVYALAGRDFPVLVGEAYNWQGAYQNTHVASAYALFILTISIAATFVYLKALRVRRETLS
ncbi:MAG: sugar ABC transporter permease [Thermodesulfobacteriota bacterium]